MFYVLICLCLTFVGIAGMQFLYLAYLERVEYEHKKRIKELEKHCKRLERKLADAENQIGSQAKIIDDFDNDGDEVWAEVIDDTVVK